MKLQLLSLSVCLCLSFSASIGARAEAGTAARVVDGAETRSAVSTEPAASVTVAGARTESPPAYDETTHLADSLRFAAIMLERAYYFAGESEDAESYLLEKASLQLRAGDREESLRTLMRVNAFLLPAGGREEYQNLLDSLSVTPVAQQGHSAFWAFVPPVGHCLAGETVWRGLLMALLDAGELSFGIWQACSGNWITAYVIGAGGLYQTYFKEGVRIVPKISRQFKNNP